MFLRITKDISYFPNLILRVVGDLEDIGRNHQVKVVAINRCVWRARRMHHVIATNCLLDWLRFLSYEQIASLLQTRRALSRDVEVSMAIP